MLVPMLTSCVMLGYFNSEFVSSSVNRNSTNRLLEVSNDNTMGSVKGYTS